MSSESLKNVQKDVEPHKVTVSDISTYTSLFHGEHDIRVTGLCGRILRGKNPEDFVTMTDDPQRRIVMLMGPDGLSLLPGKSGYEMLEAIGYMPQYIQEKVQTGTQFKLAVFTESERAKPATWDNILELVGQAYPEVTDVFEFYRLQLKNQTFSQVERGVGYSFSEIEKSGKSHPSFMTYDRFLQSPMTLGDVRAFLYFSVQLRELFSGDGFTYSENQIRGMQEYATYNKPLSELGEHALIDINVQIP